MKALSIRINVPFLHKPCNDMKLGRFCLKNGHFAFYAAVFARCCSASFFERFVIVFQTFCSENRSVFQQNLSVLSLRGGRVRPTRQSLTERFAIPERSTAKPVQRHTVGGGIMDDIRQHISLSRRLKGIAKPRLCNTPAERYRQSKRPRGSNESRGRFSVSKSLRGKLFYPKNIQVYVSLRGRSAAVAILKSKGWASRGEAREYVAKRNTYNKKHGNRCVVPLPLSSFQGFVSFRATIVRYGMTNRSVKDCRVGRTRPPRNDIIGRLDRKHGTQNPIFGIRKNVSYLLPDFDGSGLS